MTLTFLGFKITEFKDDFEHGFEVRDQQGKRVDDYPTMLRAQNAIKRISAKHEAKFGCWRERE